MHDLLNPSAALQANYVHQLRQTLHAYSAAQIVVGEVLQNAIDATVEKNGGPSKIEVHLDLDARKVTIRDQGSGFPNDPSLLFLGGSGKKGGNKKTMGLVGVGLKVVIFNSDYFCLRARTGATSFKYEISKAYQFDQQPPPPLQAPDKFPDDPTPLTSDGTEVTYSFPAGAARDPISDFLDDLVEKCLPQGLNEGFGKTLKASVGLKFFDTRFAALVASYLRRFSYAGDVLNRVGGKPELGAAKIVFTYKCWNPAATVPKVAELFDGKSNGSSDVAPSFLLVEDTVGWVPKQDKAGLFHHQLGPAGNNLTRTFKGFNTIILTTPDEYKLLLQNKYGQVKGDLNDWEKHLFPRINGILLTIGRIPHFEEFLPGGSRRVISANGVVTSHDIELTRGQNQQYVRCFDLVVDVNAQLNYGKTQLTEMFLVGRIRNYVNEAYATTIQNAAANWVGKVDPDKGDEKDVFLTRPDLGLQGYVLRKQPRDENDVIALFFELCGRGVLKGYRLFGMSQSDQYDSRASIRVQADPAHPADPADDRTAKVVEFKLTAAYVVGDFEKEAKDPKDIDLVVAWDEGAFESEQFGPADIVHSKYHPDKTFPGVTRYILDTKTGRQIQLLLLSKIVETLKATPDATFGT